MLLLCICIRYKKVIYFQVGIDSLLSFLLVIALNEVIKHKAREREKDEAIEVESQELLQNVDKLDRIIDNQLCDIKSLENIIKIYDKNLAKLDS